MSAKSEWVWMPHPAHLIVAQDCRFHMTTCVGNFIVSTVGEYLPDETVREIFAESRGVVLEGRGDARRCDYMNKLGFEKIGCNRKYETMVFLSAPATECACCPFSPHSFSEIDFDGYNDSGAAFAGHMAMCEKWADKSAQEVAA